MAHTPEQAATVTANLKNMQDFNDYVYEIGNPRIGIAYHSLLNQTNTSDPGLLVGLNILEGAFWAIGGSYGPIGNFAASFLSGMVASWAQDTPQSLSSSYATLADRFNQQTFLVDNNLTTYLGDLDKYWDTPFTFNNVTSTVGDLSAGNFPGKHTNDFIMLAGKAIFGLNQAIYTYLLSSCFQVTHWETTHPGVVPINQMSDPDAWTRDFYGSHPAYYETWERVDTSGCCGENGWRFHEYSLGGAPGYSNDNALSAEACKPIFTDLTPNHPLNPDAYFTRETVFTGLGIPVRNKIVVTGAAEAESPTQVSPAYLRAFTQQQTLGFLVQSEGREPLQARILAQAKADPGFANDLVMRPRQTLETFLSVKIPEPLQLHVIQESPSTFAIVLPDLSSNPYLTQTAPPAE